MRSNSLTRTLHNVLFGLVLSPFLLSAEGQQGVELSETFPTNDVGDGYLEASPQDWAARSANANQQVADLFPNPSAARSEGGAAAANTHRFQLKRGEGRESRKDLAQVDQWIPIDETPRTARVLPIPQGDDGQFSTQLEWTPSNDENYSPTESPMERYTRLRADGSVLPNEWYLYDEKEVTPHEEYRLQVGDTLRISIYGEAGTDRFVTIDNHGTVNYLLVGTLSVVGKTIDEFRKEMNEKMSEHLQFAIVNVVPVNFGGYHFTVLGQVNKPGKKPIEGKTSLLSALSKAGGMRAGFFRSGTVELADLKHAFLARDNQYVPLDFESLVREGNMKYNIEVLNGDYIWIPSSLNRDIYVIGEVLLPANIGFLNNETLVAAIAKARGLTRGAGRWVYIIRGSLSDPEKIEVNLRDLYHGVIPDVVLKPGDIVYVPPRDAMLLEEIVQAGLHSFVGAVGNVFGRRMFEEVEPEAKGRDTGQFFFP